MMYDVSSIKYPYLSGVGFMYGKMHVALSLGKTKSSRKFTAHDIARDINSIAPMGKPTSPRWVFITGDVSQADNLLKCVLKSTVDKLIYIEHPAKSMCDSAGMLPIWDHVCLRTTLPANPECIQIFHSVIVDGSPSPAQVDEFDMQLMKIGYNGDRYLFDSKHNRSIVRGRSRYWSLTASINESIS